MLIFIVFGMNGSHSMVLCGIQLDLWFVDVTVKYLRVSLKDLFDFRIDFLKD